MDLTVMRSRLRIDLRDEDSTSYRWSDSQLDRHVGHALRELSAAQPRPRAAVLRTTGAGRSVSLASLTDLVRVEAVEFPVDEYPTAYVGFSVREDSLAMAVDDAPAAGQEVKVYYGQLHTLDAAASTLPPHLEELLAAGAGGYAAMDLSGHAINRINLGGPETWRHYLVWGQEKLAYFRQGLANLSRRTSLRVRRLYSSTYDGTAQVPGNGL